MVEKYFQKNKKFGEDNKRIFWNIFYFIQTEAIIQQTCVEACPHALTW
jgi:hypothetical protein